jgi:hypothetical protein
MIPGIVLAEAYHQLGPKTGASVREAMEGESAELTDAQVEEIAQELLDELTKAWESQGKAGE